MVKGTDSVAERTTREREEPDVPPPVHQASVIHRIIIIACLEDGSKCSPNGAKKENQPLSKRGGENSHLYFFIIIIPFILPIKL